MTHGSLYSGIGGWLLAARWAGIENIFTVETDDFCNKILKKHFNVEQYKDIKEFSGEKYKGTIDILSTSDPCQPFSFAGKRGGTTDDRFLWPQTIRVIREIRPPYVVFENVPGFISMAFETVASDLEAEGYTVESFIIPACAIGAWHRRNRLWVIAYSNEQYDDLSGFRTSKISQFETSEVFRDINSNTNSNSKGGAHGRKSRGSVKDREKQDKCERDKIWSNSPNVCKDVPDTNSIRREECGKQFFFTEKSKEFTRNWTTEPNVGRVANGIPSRVDRLKSLGNSIVPQIAYIIFEAIKQHAINRNDT